MDKTLEKVQELLNGVEFTAKNLDPYPIGERDRQRFLCTIQKGGTLLEAEWSCGSGVALSAYLKDQTVFPKLFRAQFGHGITRTCAKRACQFGTRITLQIAEIRNAIRIHYKPLITDFVSSLLLDDSLASEYFTAEEFATSLTNDAKEAIKAMASYKAIRGRACALRRILGENFDKLQELAREL